MSGGRIKEVAWGAIFAIAVVVAAWGRWDLGDWKAELALSGGRVRPHLWGFAAFFTGLLVICAYAARRMGMPRGDNTRLTLALLLIAGLSLTIFLGQTLLQAI